MTAIRTPQRPILVAVDGSRGSDRALDVAADEARRRRAPLRIVHARIRPAIAVRVAD